MYVLRTKRKIIKEFRTVTAAREALKSAPKGAFIQYTGKALARK